MIALPKSSDPPDEQFVAAKTLLEEILRVPELQLVFDLDERPHTKIVYTQAVTIWLLIVQRLFGGASLRQVLSDAVTRPT